MNTLASNHPRSLILPPPALRTEDGIAHYDNPHPRCPVALLLDVSDSMAGAPVAELSQGLQAFFADVAADDLASLRVDPAIFTFGGTVEQVMPFGTTEVGVPVTPPRLTTQGGTPLGAAVRTAVVAIEARRRLYRDCALASYFPWVVILSDGAPNDRGWEEAADQLRGLAQSRWNVLAVGIGDNANLEILQRFAVHPARRLSATRFREFFRWLSDSLKVTSRSPIAQAPAPGLPAVLPALPPL